MVSRSEIADCCLDERESACLGVTLLRFLKFNPFLPHNQLKNGRWYIETLWRLVRLYITS